MFDKYIQKNEKKIIAGQTSNGVWYCKEIIAETPTELKLLIGDVNKILNDYNMDNKKEKKTPTPPKKEKNIDVRM